MRARTYSTFSPYTPTSDDEQPPPDRARYAAGSIDEESALIDLGDHPLIISHHPRPVAKCYLFLKAIDRLYGED